MTKFIISDTHFNHESLLCILPDPRPEDYVSRIFKQLMILNENDILYHLWDICIWQDKDMHDRYIVPLKCKKILIRWNHDKKSDSWYLDHGWDFVCTAIRIIYQSKTIWLSHQPMDIQCDYNIHWHYHNRFDLESLDWKHILYSAERERYMPITIESLLRKDNLRRSNTNNKE